MPSKETSLDSGLLVQPGNVIFVVTVIALIMILLLTTRGSIKRFRRLPLPQSLTIYSQ